MRGGKCKPSAPCEKRQGAAVPPVGLGMLRGHRGAAGCARGQTPRLGHRAAGWGSASTGAPARPRSRSAEFHVSRGGLPERVASSSPWAAHSEPARLARGRAALCSANRHSEPCPGAARASLLPEKIGLQELLTLRLKLSSSVCDAGSLN